MNKSKRYTVPSECGFLRVSNYKTFGTLTAKFDTGNSINCVLHADDIKVTGNQVTFKHNETHKQNTMGKYTSVTGGGEDERHIVDLDIEFAGTLYKDVEFTLDDRKEWNRNFLTETL